MRLIDNDNPANHYDNSDYWSATDQVLTDEEFDSLARLHGVPLIVREYPPPKPRYFNRQVFFAAFVAIMLVGSFVISVALWIGDLIGGKL